MLETSSIPRQLKGPAGKLEAKGRRLGMDTVSSPDGERLTVLFGPRRHRRECSVDPLEHEAPRVPRRERERGVEYVR